MSRSFARPETNITRKPRAACRSLDASRLEWSDEPATSPKGPKIENPPTCYRSLSGPSGPKSPRECPRKRGVSEGVSDGVPPGSFGPRAPKCAKSVPRVSPECQRGVPDTPGTLSGHLLRARRARDTPVAGWGVLNPKN